MWEAVIQELQTRYGPFDAQTEWLLQQAYNTREQGLISGPLIVLMAIRSEGVLNQLYNISGGADLLRILQRPNLERELRTWVSNSQNTLPGGSHYARGLLIALDKERKVAGQNVRILWYHFLWTLVYDDPDMQGVLGKLDNSVNLPSYPSNDSSITGGRLFSVHSAGQAVTAARQEPTANLRYARRHHVDMVQLLFDIEQRQVSEVIIVRGMDGSPRERLPKVLADIVADGREERLAEIKRVFVVSVGQLQAAAVRDPDASSSALEACIEQAKDLNGILILTDGELLASSDRVNAYLLSVLARPGSTPVIISYEDANEVEAQRPIDLPYIQPRLVVMAPYTPENTQNALPEYYSDYLSDQHIYLNQDTFASIYALADAITVESRGRFKRKVLPYSASEVLIKTVETLRKERNPHATIRAQALTAKQSAEHLIHDRLEGRKLLTALVKLDTWLEQGGHGEQTVLRDAKQVTEIWGARWKLIDGIPGRMAQLAEEMSTQLPFDDMADMAPVTLNMLTAQLLSDPTWHIRLWQAFERTLDNFDPGVRDIIEDA